MNTMKMPKMSAVRFTESDVIVASTRITLNKFGNGVNGDAYVRYMGVNYGSNQQSGDINDFYSAFNADHFTGINGDTNIGFETQSGSGYIDFDGALALDNAAASSSIDGPYIWNGSFFERQ